MESHQAFGLPAPLPQRHRGTENQSETRNVRDGFFLLSVSLGSLWLNLIERFSLATTFESH